MLASSSSDGAGVGVGVGGIGRAGCHVDGPPLPPLRLAGSILIFLWRES